jgi:hypothetical protein
VSQRVDWRLALNCHLMRWSWGAARATDVSPTQPAPTRTIGVRHSAKPTILSISLSCPERILGGGGGDSPGTLNVSGMPDSLIAGIADLL